MITLLSKLVSDFSWRCYVLCLLLRLFTIAMPYIYVCCDNCVLQIGPTIATKVLQLAFKPRTKLSAEGAVTIATLQRVALCLWRCCVTEGVRAAVLEAKSSTSTVYSAAAAATASSTALSAAGPTAAVADSGTSNSNTVNSSSTSSSSGSGTQLTVVTAQPPPALHSSSSGNSSVGSKHTSALRTGVLDPLCALLTLAKAALAQADWRALELLLGEAKALFHTSPAASAAAMAWLAGGFANSAGAATDADDFSDDETDDEEQDHVASDVSQTVSPDTATTAAAAAAVGASPSSRKAAGSSSSGGSSSAKKAAKAQAAGASAHARSASTAANTGASSAAASSLWRVLEWAYVPPSPAKDPHFYEHMADEISRDMQGVSAAGSTAGAAAAAAAAVAAMRAVAQALSTSLWHAADTDAGGALFLPPRAVTDSELAGLWLLQEAFQTAGGVSLAGHTFAALCTDLAAATAGGLERALLLAPLLCRLLCCDGSRRCAHWQVHSVAAALSRYEAVAAALRTTLTAVHSSSSSSSSNEAAAATTLLTTFTQVLVAAALEESEGVIATAWRDAELHTEAAKLQHAVATTAAAGTVDTAVSDASELPSFGAMEGLVVHNSSSSSSSASSKPWVWGRRCALRCPAALFALIDILVPWSTTVTADSSGNATSAAAAVSALKFAVGCVLPALTFGCPISLESLVNAGAVRRLLELLASEHTTADTAVADDTQLEQVRPSY
jgi:hypothetical protein